MPLPPRNPEYIAEYNVLSAKVAHSVSDLHTAEVILSSAILLFYGWIFKDGTELLQSARYVLFAPIMLPVIAILRLIFRQRYLRGLEDYLRDLEEYLFYDRRSPGGWERRYNANRSAYGIVRLSVWIIILAATIFVAVYGAELAKSAKASDKSNAAVQWHGSVSCNWKVDK